ncbi:MAG: trypsin-like peptidase domain-containing protein [Gammaproteobacteria bacterium]|jgi:Do/DeqQ family serine protease
MKFYRAFSFVFTSVATGLAAAFLLVLLRPDLVSPRSVPQRPVVAAAPSVDSYAEAVAAAAPSVVSVFASKLTRERRNPLLDDPLFRRFFGGGDEQPKVRRENSLGSGVMVDPNGYVLTNNHVIDGASEIRVALGDGSEVPARVVGVDPDTDLAVLQAGGEIPLPVASLGRSDDLRVGDVVLAIGNPFAVGQTVTMGIVSATGRNQLGITNFENFIQTDAAINPGNSGGALVNTRGEIVGINTAIFSRSGGSLGIGFAIPVQIAQAVMAEIIEHGRVIRGWLGITGQNLTVALAESLGLEGASGILVSGVLPDGPADLAGIAPGDVIVAVDGQAITGSVDLLNRIAGYAPGTRVAVDIVREHGAATLHARVEERPRDVSP